MVHAVNSGHPGGSLGCVEYFYSTLWKSNELQTPFLYGRKGEDHFYLSNGHISPVFLFYISKKRFFPISELSTFRKLNSRLQGHPTTHEHLEGIRMSSGSLGQGLSVGIGVALAQKLDGDSSFSVYTSWRRRITRRTNLGSINVCCC